MRIMRARKLVPLAVTLTVLALPLAGIAGTAVDPNLNDSVLGTVGGIRYATDTAAYDAGSSGFADVVAGCGGSRWHLFGGGTNAAGPVAKSYVAAEQPEDYTDADSLRDDGWASDGVGTSPAMLHSYTVCLKHAASYPSRVVANGSSALRTAQVACPGTQRVTSGAMFIATSGSWETSSYPYDGPDKDKVPDDGWRGGVYDTIGGIGGFQAFAVCSSGLKLHYVKSPTTKVKVGSAASVKVSCAADQHVVGGGARLTGTQSTGRLVASFPYDGPDKDKAPDDGWLTKVYSLGGGPKQLTAWAICVG
jgi:hypothetical protein